MKMNNDVLIRKEMWLPVKRGFIGCFVLIAALCWQIDTAHASSHQPSLYLGYIFKEKGLEVSQIERQLLAGLQHKQYIQVRRVAEKLLIQLRKRKEASFVVHFVLFYVYRYIEGEMMMSLWNLKRARRLFVAQGGKALRASLTHRSMLVELIDLLRSLGRDQEALSWLRQHDAWFPKEPLKELMPWTLMRLGRFKQAEQLATRMLLTKKNASWALNSLCAIHFEQGHRRRTLRFCKRAYLRMKQKKKPSKGDHVIHLMNMAEAELAMFDFGGAERHGLQATVFFDPGIHANPWAFMVNLFLEQGRFNDAWNALRREKKWFGRQVPSLSESLYASHQMTQARFFLMAGRPRFALKLLERVKDRPDRQGHVSAKTYQQSAGARLMRHHALLMRLEQRREQIAVKGFWSRLWSWFARWPMRVRASREGAQLRKMFANPEFLRNTLAPYRAGGAEIPYWLNTSLVPIMGPAVIRARIGDVRANEGRKVKQVHSFLDVIEADAAFHQGNYDTAQRMGQRALAALSPRLIPMRMRAKAVLARVAWSRGAYRKGLTHMSQILEKDGMTFRRMGMSVPVRFVLRGGGKVSEIHDALSHSPRFSEHHAGFPLVLQRYDRNRIAFRLNRVGAVTRLLYDIPPVGSKNYAKFTKYVIDDIHKRLFSSYVEAVKGNISSLDNALFHTPTYKLPWKQIYRDLQ